MTVYIGQFGIPRIGKPVKDFRVVECSVELPANPTAIEITKFFQSGKYFDEFYNALTYSKEQLKEEEPIVCIFNRPYYVLVCEALLKYNELAIPLQGSDVFGKSSNPLFPLFVEVQNLALSLVMKDIAVAGYKLDEMPSITSNPLVHVSREH